jgi:hypothetical protein
MNEHQIALMDNLSVFNHVVTEGTRITFNSESKYQLDGLTAWHDYDGYTCYLAYKDLTLTLLFHGKFAMEYEDKKTLSEFYSKSKQILKSK